MMEWGAEQIALAIAGALFLLGVVASLHPRLTLSLSSRIVLSSAAGAYLAAAIAFSRIESPLYAPLLWLVPLSVAVVVARDIVSHWGVYVLHGLPILRRDASSDLEPSGPAAAAAQAGVGDETRAGIDRAMDPAASSAELEELAYTLPEARRAVAAHAATPASVLSWLAAHGDDAVVAAIAARQGPGEATHSER
ncbi:MAG: hypothetical protein H5T82_10425 [Demequina sp.]|nr:hypothetical protein [Demequina sp.]